MHVLAFFIFDINGQKSKRTLALSRTELHRRQQRFRAFPFPITPQRMR